MFAVSGVTGAQDGGRGQAAGRENGWYRIIDGVADSIAPRPVLTVKEFAELRLDTNYFGNPIIIGRASVHKLKAWADSTEAVTGHRLGFVIDGKVVTAPRVNSRDTLFGTISKSRQDSLMSVIDYWDARAVAEALRGR